MILTLMYTRYTREKTHKLLHVCKQVVTTRLFTSCQQVVFALLVPSLLKTSLEQVVNNL